MIQITFDTPITIGDSTLSGVESEQVIVTPLQIHVYAKSGSMKRLPVLGLSDATKALHQSWLDALAEAAKSEWESGAITAHEAEVIAAENDQTPQEIDHSND